jgi:hypothetical protein
MNESHIPPEVVSFPTDYDGIMATLAPYYFVQNYLAEDSRVDVWEGDSLEQAERRIDEYKSKIRQS